MKLMLLGYFGFGNAGDEAVLAAELVALRGTLGATTEFVAVSGDPARTTALHGIPAVGRTDVGAVLRALRTCDGLVAGGGSLLQDVTSARPVAFYGGLMLAARSMRTPVFVYAQGLGPLRRRANRTLAGAALRSARYVAVRDPGSLTLAARLGVRGLDLVPDPVLGMELGVGASASTPTGAVHRCGASAVPCAARRGGAPLARLGRVGWVAAGAAVGVGGARAGCRGHRGAVP